MNIWTPPRELTQSVPRSIRIRGRLLMLFGLITALLPGIAVLLIVSILYGDREMMIMKERGIATEGTVINLNSPGPGHGHHIEYRFMGSHANNDGSRMSREAIYQRRDGVDWHHYMHLTVGSKVPVIYDPSNPNTSALNFEDSVRTSDPFENMKFLYVLMLCVFGIPYTVIMTVCLIPICKQIRLIKWGRAAEATIIEKKEVQGRARTITVTYRFRDADGKIVQGVRKLLPTDADLNNATVVYDPRNSAKNMLYSWPAVVCHLPGQSRDW